jgi:hypothetical protein
VVVEERSAQRPLRAEIELIQLAARHAADASQGRLPTRERAQQEILEAARKAAPQGQPAPPAAQPAQPAAPSAQPPARPGQRPPPR